MGASAAQSGLRVLGSTLERPAMVPPCHRYTHSCGLGKSVRRQIHESFHTPVARKPLRHSASSGGGEGAGGDGCGGDGGEEGSQGGGGSGGEGGGEGGGDCGVGGGRGDEGGGVDGEDEGDVRGEDGGGM